MHHDSTQSAQPARLLTWNACYNTRELGGYLTASQQQTRWNAFVRSDSLHRLDEVGQTALIKYGVKTIIDLRTREEVESDPNAFMRAGQQMPVTTLYIPILDSTDIGWQNGSRAANTMIDLYSAMLSTFGRQFAAVMKAIANATPGTIAFYCHVGKDRTGLVAALLLSLAEVPAETIINDYADSDLYLEPVYAELRQDAANNPERQKQLQWLLQCLPETMSSTLDHLATQYGGAEDYLLGNGVTTGEIAQIRGRLLG